MENWDLKKTLVAVGIGIILVAGLWYFFYYQGASEEINRLQLDISRLSRYKKQMPVLLRKYRKAQEEFKVYSKQLPLKEEIPSLLVKLNTIIRDEGVSLISFNPQKAIRDKSGIYFIKPIYVKIEATYMQCGKIFEDIAKMERLFKVKDFSISNPKIVNMHKVLLDISFYATTYYLNKRKKWK